MVTAETAIALSVLLLVTAALAWLVAVGVAQVRCVDAARDAARAVAREESFAVARRMATRVAPDGARIDIRAGADAARVRVSYRATLPGRLFDDVVAIDLEAVSQLPLEFPR